MKHVHELESQIQLLDTKGGEETLKVDLLSRLSYELASEEPKRALKIAGEARDLAVGLSYERGIAYSLLGIGFSQSMLSDHGAALPTLFESLPMFDRLEDRFGRARNLMAIAQTQLSMGDYSQALSNGFEGLKTFRELGRRLDEAWMLYGIAVAYHELGDYDRSLEQHRKSMEIFKELDSCVGQARSLTGIGTVYQSQGELEKAAEHQRRALEIFRGEGNRIGESRALNDIGTVYQQLGQFDQAREFHLKSLKIRRQTGNRQAESTSLLNLGTLDMEEGHLPEALKTLLEALEIARAAGATPRIYQCHHALAEVYKRQEDLRRALEHYQQFHRLKEEVAGEEAVSRIKNLQIGHAIEKSEREAEITQTKNKELEDKNRQLENLLGELKATQAHLIQSEKMAALGGIVSGIVHELNTPVGVINSAIDVSSQFATDIMTSLSAGRSIDEIRDEGALASTLDALGENNRATRLATARIEKFVNSLRSFARLDGAVFEQVNVHDGIETTLDLLEGRLRDKISVVKDFGELPLVSCYSSELNQVFLNLLTNAIQAINRKGTGSGTITIRTRLEAGRVKIEFSDTGGGIAADEIDRLFDPTFSRKGSRVKASLGLVACYNIMEKHGGEIRVDSQEGQGSTFTLVLPVSRQIWPQMA